MISAEARRIALQVLRERDITPDLEAGKSLSGMEERLRNAKNVTAKENQHHQESLAQAKGRAQVTASTAMSIVNVALLKSVLDGGPKQQHYILRIVLISISLALQILAGLMSLIIEQANGYMNKYGGNICDDFSNLCCLLRCVKNKRKVHQPIENSQTGVDSPDDILNSTCIQKTLVYDEAENPLCKCCPFLITTIVYARHEIQAMELYNDFRLNYVNNEISTIQNEKELKYQKMVVEEAENKLAVLMEQTKKADASSSDIKQDIDQLKAKLDEAEAKKRQYEASLKKANVVREQAKILKEYVGTAKKNRMLKLVSFWQQMLNYVFYAIFIVNAFITGFGLGTTPVGDEAATVAQNFTI